MKRHRYRTEVEWTGNTGTGTANYRDYRRDHVVQAGAKAPIPASSDPAFRGDPTRYNPEELLVASLSSCHMLWYLHLCAVNGVVVTAYRDEAEGEMTESPDGAGEFTRVVLRPAVTISAGDPDRARALHAEAHRFCFVARSVKFPVGCEAEIVITAGA